MKSYKNILGILHPVLKALTGRNISCAFIYLKTIDANGTEVQQVPENDFQDVSIQVVNEYGEQTGPYAPVYDHRGAMYFAVAVISIYGLSIALLIASTVRRSGEDYEVKGFIRSFANLDKSKKPREKFRVQKALLESGILLRLNSEDIPIDTLSSLLVCATPICPTSSGSGTGKQHHLAGSPGSSSVQSDGSSVSVTDSLPAADSVN